jgi:hypothetical protein
MLYQLSYASNSGESRASAQANPSDPFQMTGTIIKGTISGILGARKLGVVGLGAAYCGVEIPLLPVNHRLLRFLIAYAKAALRLTVPPFLGHSK